MGPLANLLVIGTAVALTAVSRFEPDAYYALVQEDGAVEWGTFWAFVLAAAAAAATAVSRLRRRELPWWSAGLALFCLLVALEEISWGQRLLGYRPPSYFLEHNFQQELNVHNIASKELRKLALGLIIAGYGIALPLLAWPLRLRRWVERIGVVAPSRSLVPAFAATLLLYVLYPLRFTGEVVELMLGGCFLFALAERAPLPDRLGQPFGAVVAGGVLVAALGWATASWQATRGAAPALLERTRLEVSALGRDLERLAADGGSPWLTRCGTHKRVYSYVRKYGVEGLTRLEYASGGGAAGSTRRAFFLDPWNSPYWIRDTCGAAGERRVFVYSFGPNRRRESSPWEVLGDDVGAAIGPASPERVALGE